MIDWRCACATRQVHRGHCLSLSRDKTIKLSETLGAILVMSALLVALPGCQKQEGPTQQAGKKADKAVEQAGQQIEKAGESAQDAAKGDK